MRNASRAALALLLLCLAPGDARAQTADGAARPPKDPAHWRAALEHVSAESMRGHLSFLSSDALEGRRTPSRGLDIAAEYIAAQFRRAGLEPVGDDGYFQTANWLLSARDPAAFRLAFAGAQAPPAVRSEQLGVGLGLAGFNFWEPEGELDLTGAPLLKLDYANVPAGLTREQVEGRVVLTEFPAFPRGDQGRALQLLREGHEFLARMRGLGARLVLSFDRRSERARGRGGPRVIDPERRGGGRNAPDLGLGAAQAASLVVVHGAEAARFYDSLPAGAAGGATVDVRVPAAAETPVKVRNVAGVLRGSDASLRDTYVIVSAHYDHIGLRDNCDPAKEDCVNNGANDDGSGTVAVIELASALSKLGRRPRRSVLFLTFFGEELGLVGSRHYGRRPLVPLAKTIAQLNMEQVGRTDDSEGPQVGTLALTGFDYSEVGAALERAGAAEGVRVYKHPKNSDAYFSRSDNQSLADAGVPAHTASVAFQFPDYHAVGDEWHKVDFANMARVTRAVGRAALSLADSAREPRWNEQNPLAAPYVEAWKKLHAKP